MTTQVCEVARIDRFAPHATRGNLASLNTTGVAQPMGADGVVKKAKRGIRNQADPRRVSVRDSAQAVLAETSLGPMLVMGTTKGVSRIQFGDNRLEMQVERDRLTSHVSGFIDPTFQSWVTAIVKHVDSPVRDLDVPLDIAGTTFQQQVWDELLRIPRGQTISYSELAQRIGKPRATRAVASACASNQIAVLIPCHRVVRSDGGLGGYRWGIDRKKELLKREASQSRSCEGSE